MWTARLNKPEPCQARGRSISKGAGIHPAKDVFRAVLLVAKANCADQIDQLTKTLLVECGSGVVLGEHAFELRILFLNRKHGLVDDLANFSLLGIGLKMLPAGFLGNPEDVCPAYSSRSSGSACFSFCNSLWRSSKASEMYLRKISPRTTCLYSEASMWPRNLSAAAHNFCSNPRFAPFEDFVKLVRCLAIRDAGVVYSRLPEDTHSPQS
jgi:hypothetical protein